MSPLVPEGPGSFCIEEQHLYNVELWQHLSGAIQEQLLKPCHVPHAGIISEGHDLHSSHAHAHVAGHFDFLIWK